jgi:hypothetical protein
VDGFPHFWVAVWDPAAADGQKRKIYLDGRMVGADTSLASIASGGTMWIGGLTNTAEPYKGLLDGLFATDYALTPEVVAALFAVGSRALGGSQYPAGDLVEAADATNLYLLANLMAPQNLLDLKVAA